MWGTDLVWDVLVRGSTPHQHQVPPSGKQTPLWHLFNTYYGKAQEWLATHSGEAGKGNQTEFRAWAAQYFEKLV